MNPDHDAEEASIERLAAGDIEDFELLSNEIWRELCQLRGLNEGVVGRDVWETLCRRRKWLHGRFGYLRH